MLRLNSETIRMSASIPCGSPDLIFPSGANGWLQHIICMSFSRLGADGG